MKKLYKLTERQGTVICLVLDRSARILGEVKNYSGTISLTAQLKDFALWSQLNGYQMHLYTNSTSFTGPLQQLIDSGVIQVFPIG